MDIINVAKQIEQTIEDMKRGRSILIERASIKSRAIAEYDKELAKVIIGLRNGKEFILDNEAIKDPPATLIPKIAQGILWEKALKKDLAEAEYRNAVVGIDILAAELNGWQSIFRHLNET